MDKSEELNAFARKWDEAMITNNANAIGEFMSDDWVIVGTEGGITNRETFLDFIRSGDLTHNRMDSNDIRAKIYGDAGVLTSRGTSAGEYKGEPFSFFEWSTSVFVFREDGWKCVHTMLTPAQ